MPRLDYASPLIALTAIVADTETTGLDTARARLIEFGAIVLDRGVIAHEGFAVRINPREPIPASATRIHGIDDATVANAPAFADAWPGIKAFAGERLWIGHTLGFDLAILARECARAGLAFAPPPALDTRLLAQIANPNLPGYTLETLASWLGVTPGERHSALGDAITTARIFQALAVKLREGGIRTLSEAMRASAALTDALDRQHRAGWVEIASRPEPPLQSEKIDSFAYRTRAGDVASMPPRFAAADDRVQSALAAMMEARVSSLFISPDGRPARASACGVVTERDVLRAFATHGADAAGLALGAIMSRPLEAISGDAFVYAAAARMARLRIRHLAVVDDAGYVVGALSARDLLRSRTSQALALGDEIEAAQDGRALAVAWAKLPRVAAALIGEGMEGRDLAQLASHEIGVLTARAAAIAQESLRAEGQGEPPCGYAVLVLGSAGRGESLLAMDQDNAIVFERGEPGGREDAWFAALAARMNAFLDEAGAPLCKGGVMARNPQWRGSLDAWRQRVSAWVERSTPSDLLSVDTFFDLRGVHGDLALANELRAAAFEAARGRNAFAKLLLETAAPMERALGMFGRLRTHEGRVDIKKSGLFRIVSGARALAIRHHILAYSTRERLEAVRALGKGGDQDLERLIDAHGLFLTLIARQQVADIAIGRPPSNTVEPGALTRLDRERLIEALQALEPFETLVKDLLFVD
ncbi:MAG: CBS domain-containing protein [Beijerinckiaceae bacterium]|nr:CBS domain-containing protein [Beijerinckiaceae bacterium]